MFEYQKKEFVTKQTSIDFTSIKIKKEPESQYVSVIESDLIKIIKSEPNVDESEVNIKKEIKIENHIQKYPKIEHKNNLDTFFNNITKAQEIKKEKQDEELETPVKTETKPEMFWDESNPSPFNKEMLRSFSIQSPLVSDDSQSSSRNETRKSVRRTVFQRESPYKRYFDQDPEVNTKLRVSVKDRLGPKVCETTFQ